MACRRVPRSGLRGAVHARTGVAGQRGAGVMRHLRAAELSLAERFYFLTHDLHGGRRLHAQAIGYGVAACAIAELVWSGWATVERHTDPFNDDGLLTLTDRRLAAPADLSRHHGDAGAAGAALP